MSTFFFCFSCPSSSSSSSSHSAAAAPPSSSSSSSKSGQTHKQFPPSFWKANSFSFYHQDLQNQVINPEEIEVSLSNNNNYTNGEPEQHAPVSINYTSKVSSSSSSSSSSSWKEELPIELRNRGTIYKISNIDGCDVYLLGTSHVSRKSCDDVKVLMNHVVPDCLFIELCPQRLPIIISPISSSSSSSETTNNDNDLSTPNSKATTSNTTDEDNSLSFFSQLYSLQQQTGMSYCNAFSATLLTKVQTDYASKLEVNAGGEFKEAYQSKPLHCRVILGDRPVKVSLVRSWESLSIWGKLKLICCLLYSAFKQPSEEEIREWMEKVLNDENGDALTQSIQEFAKHFPSIQRIIISERDSYMYAKIRQSIRCLKCKKLVAVVGAGHCKGIMKWFSRDKEEYIDLEDILKGVVETNNMKVDENAYVKALTTDIIELHNNPQ